MVHLSRAVEDAERLDDARNWYRQVTARFPDSERGSRRLPGHCLVSIASAAFSNCGPETRPAMSST